MAERRVDVYDGSGDIDLWLIKMKFYCSTKKYEGKQEAHAIASKLDGPAFLCIARLSDEDQDDPKKVKEALKREFDKVAVDHETAVAELAQIKRISDETPAQLAWRVEKVTRKAYPGLSEAKEESATQTYEQMLQDKFLEAIDEEMSKKIKERTGLMTARVCIAPKEIEDGKIPICVWNVSDKPIRVYREQSAAIAEEIRGQPKIVSQVIEQGDTTSKPVEYDPVSEVQIGNELNSDERKRINELLRNNKDVFDYPGNEGFTTTETHTIPTGNTEPIICPPRRHNFGLTEKINEAVEKHLKAGHIKPSRSPWAFPIVPVLKPDKTVRLCVDYKPLNEVTQSDPFPTGNIREVLDNMAGAQYFSVIDLAQGYLQVPLKEQDQAKTAFRSPTGFWEWTRMCYGLKGSPATFARLMRKVVNQIPADRLALYMDDLCIISKTFDDHLRNLQQVFDALRRHGLRIKAKKCFLVMREVKFLGHRVSKEGVHPTQEKVQAINSWPMPTSVKEVQKFLGVTGWYRKFIKNFSGKARPLTKLLEKNAVFVWNTEQEDAFIFLKNCLITAPVLAHPKPDAEFVVTTDASSVGIGGELAQPDDDGNLHPVAYFSRCLTKRERSYPTYDREVLAIRDTLKHYRYYLLGRKFRLRTDHKPLLKMLEVQDPFGRRATMLRDIAEFEPQMEFVRGCDNVVADALSRIGITPSETNRDGGQMVMGITKNERVKDFIANLDDFQREQTSDPSLEPYISSSKNKEGLFVIQGSGQVLVPSSKVLDVLSLAHDETGHQGSQKVIERITRNFWWPTMNKDIVQYIQSCRRCAATLQQGKRDAPLSVRPKENRPFQLVEADLKGPLPKARYGYNNILVLMDPTTKFAEMHPVADQQSTTVCKKLKDWISRYGIPIRLHTDNGPCFVSEMMENLCNEHGIKHTFSDPYRPQGNSGVERLNRTMAESLTKLVDNHPKSWPDFLPEVQLAYNAATHSSTGITPYELVFRAHPRTKLDIVAEQLSSETVDNHTALLEERGEEIYETARAQDTDSSRQRVEKYNQNTKPFQPLREGDKVWIKKMKKKTFTDHWEGPFAIIRPKSKKGTSYIVRRVGGTRTRTVHYNNLKPYLITKGPQRAQSLNKRDKMEDTFNESQEGMVNEYSEESSTSESELEGEPDPPRRYPLRNRREPNRLFL